MQFRENSLHLGRLDDVAVSMEARCTNYTRTRLATQAGRSWRISLRQCTRFSHNARAMGDYLDELRIKIDDFTVQPFVPACVNPAS